MTLPFGLKFAHLPGGIGHVRVPAHFRHERFRAGDQLLAQRGGRLPTRLQWCFDAVDTSAQSLLQ
jgi:hypothetical protein